MVLIAVAFALFPSASTTILVPVLLTTPTVAAKPTPAIAYVSFWAIASEAVRVSVTLARIVATRRVPSLAS